MAAVLAQFCVVHVSIVHLRIREVDQLIPKSLYPTTSGNTYWQVESESSILNCKYCPRLSVCPSFRSPLWGAVYCDEYVCLSLSSYHLTSYSRQDKDIDETFSQPIY